MLSSREDSGLLLPVAKGCCVSDAALGPVVEAWLKTGVWGVHFALVCCPGLSSITVQMVTFVPIASGRPCLLRCSPSATPVGQFRLTVIFGRGVGGWVGMASGRFPLFSGKANGVLAIACCNIPRVYSYRVHWPHCVVLFCLVNVPNLNQT